MINICIGKDVVDLLTRVRQSAWQFSDVTFCSPFIGEDEAKLVARLMLDGHKSGCGIRVITTKPAGTMLKNLLPMEAVAARRRVLVRDDLHAKFYLAIARRPGASEVIVTSANLTAPGLGINQELGVRATSNCDDGVRLVNNVANYAQRLAA